MRIYIDIIGIVICLAVFAWIDWHLLLFALALTLGYLGCRVLIAMF